VFLDDTRQPPDGYTLVRTAEEAIELLKSGSVTHLSLDHDLGIFTETGEVTGYNVVLWLEQAVVEGTLTPPEVITVHSSNPGARTKMELAIKSIRRLAEQDRQ